MTKGELSIQFYLEMLDLIFSPATPIRNNTWEKYVYLSGVRDYLRTHASLPSALEENLESMDLYADGVDDCVKWLDGEESELDGELEQLEEVLKPYMKETVHD